MPSNTGSPLGISVVICCYNSSSRLPQTLKHLAKQKITKPNLQWEILVIDNASTDNTALVARNEWEKYKNNAPLFIIPQPIPGTGPARDLGIEKANFEFILFCDDDNWLAENYVELAYEIMISNPHISALGGHANDICEITPPVWFESLKSAYAIGGQGPVKHGEISKIRGFIYTAGGVFRKSVLKDIEKKGFIKILTGRTGKNLNPGEDVELCYALILTGNKIYYDERMQFQHFLPKGRLSWAYYKKMKKGFGNTYPFLMPYKLLINKQKERFNHGIIWLYVTGLYLIIKNIFFELPLAFFGKNYYQVRSDLESHFGFITNLFRHHKKVTNLFEELKIADWISEEFKP
ncbi:glycosyltransferase [Adhaeribacter rhizoryzae]|uniref:Glycosyltransferase family 2 protein n=1 Tax=Adhaeribacter rhizoryzae TaxID=2607907 RepID=A0A5M6DSD2_9BACT|nr:glycosyltransferase [Adhaeribacter rhizoryzae]KAA5548315.1 glycosyltransferase family 2 protein [Adhaeribacter rhizoryzae]